MIQTKLFSFLYLAKFLNTSAISFFPCKSNFQRDIFSNKSLSCDPQKCFFRLHEIENMILFSAMSQRVGKKFTDATLRITLL